jgi:hypothetical protein
MRGLRGLLGCSYRSPLQKAGLPVMIAGLIQREMVSQECGVGS